MDTPTRVQIRDGAVAFHKTQIMCGLIYFFNGISTVSFFNGISTFMGYLMPKPSLKKNSSDAI